MLTTLFFIPLIGALSLLFVNNKSTMKQISLGSTIVNFIISLVLWAKFDNNTHEYQFVEDFAELSFCHFHVGIDGISLFFVLLTTFLFPIIILTSWDHKNNLKHYLLNFLIKSYIIPLSTVVIFILLPTFIEEPEILLSVFVPVMIYDNAETDKSRILSDNKGKAAIYLWRHIKSGRIYIGSTFNLSIRMSQYFSASWIKYADNYISRALILHTHSAFSLTILQYINISNFQDFEEARDFILDTEQYYLDWIFLIDKPDTYNINPKADSRLGSKHSAESRELMSLAKSGENHPMYGKCGEDHPRGMLGKTHTVETKILLSKAKLGNRFTEEHKINISNAKIKKVFVYTLDSNSKSPILHISFNTRVEAMKFFDCSSRTLSNYLDKNKLYQNKLDKKQYILSSSKLD